MSKLQPKFPYDWPLIGYPAINGLLCGLIVVLVWHIIVAIIGVK